VFETEEQARAAPPEGAEAPAVTLGKPEFGEIISSAWRPGWFMAPRRRLPPNFRTAHRPGNVRGQS
jgi:hypothetical protein